MRSLFFRIFVNFLAATVLISVLLLALALTTDPQRIVFAPHEKRLDRIGKEMLEAYRTGGSAALQEIDASANGRRSRRLILFRNSEGPLSGREAPLLAQQLAAKTAVTGERQVQKGPHGPPLIAMPLGDGYVLVAVVPPPSPLEMFLNPYGLTLRLGAVFLVTGLISYLLGPLVERSRADIAQRDAATGERRLVRPGRPVPAREPGRDRRTWTGHRPNGGTNRRPA